MDPISIAVALASTGAATALAGRVVSWIVAARDRNRKGELSELMGALDSAIALSTPLDAKLNRAITASRELAELTGEITTELDAQVAETKRLQSEAAEAKAFMSANEEVVVAMRAMLRSEMREELKAEFETRGKSDRRFQVGLAIGSFLAGIAGTIVFQIVWTALTAPTAT